MFPTGSKPPDDTYETIPMQYTPSRNQEQVSATEPMTQDNPAYQKHATNRSDGGRLEMTPNAAYDTQMFQLVAEETTTKIPTAVTRTLISSRSLHQSISPLLASDLQSLDREDTLIHLYLIL